MTQRSCDRTGERGREGNPLRPFGALALLVGLCLSATGCAKGTYLEIMFTGPATLPAVRLQLDLTLTGPNGVTQSHDLVPAATEQPTNLPASMALKLDSESGTLKIDATAIEPAAGGPRVVGRGSNTTTIMHGETWTVNVPIQAGTATTN